MSFCQEFAEDLGYICKKQVVYGKRFIRKNNFRRTQEVLDGMRDNKKVILSYKGNSMQEFKDMTVPLHKTQQETLVDKEYYLKDTGRIALNVYLKYKEDLSNN